MDYLSSLPSCATVLIFLCVLGLGNSLECYTCNATFSNINDEPCKDTNTLKKCADPAVCLSATHLFENPESTFKQYTVVKSCYLAIPNACDKFLQHMKVISPEGKIEFTKDQPCYTCSEPGCNKYSTKDKPVPPAGDSGASMNTVPALLFFVLFCFLLNKF